MLAFQGDAVLACSPAIKGRIDLTTIWQLACNGATRSLERYGARVAGLPFDCPFTMHEPLDAAFDPAGAANLIGAAMRNAPQEK